MVLAPSYGNGKQENVPRIARGMEFHPREENCNCETEKGLPSDP